MPSARDLLQQADTLMRSNRSVGAADPDGAVPLLTDVAVPGGSGISHSQRRDEIPVLTNAVTSFLDPAFEMSVGDDSLPRFPATKDARGVHSQSEARTRFSATATLRDSTIFPISQMPQPTMPGADELLRHADLEPARETEPVFSVTAMRAQLEEAGNWDAGMIAPTPGAPARVEPALLASDALDPALQAPVAVAIASPPLGPTEDMPIAVTNEFAPADAVKAGDAPVAAVAAEPAPSAAEIAETVYYQVLQNLDLYTERALQEHLTTYLAPILERASNELLATLHANLGGLIRQYVAEAIEKQLGVRPEAGR
ncbi:MAG: hypothetical protein IPM02_04380 [Betaproteobacteria bacterium]|nr:hypothetical protein [Betaproteobacteria bacterium]